MKVPIGLTLCKGLWRNENRYRCYLRQQMELQTLFDLDQRDFWARA